MKKLIVFFCAVFLIFVTYALFHYESISDVKKTYNSDTKKFYNKEETDVLKGDGISDDTKVIQKYLNQAKENGKAEIHLPDGKYRLTRPLHIYSNTHLILSKNAVLLRDHDRYMLSNGESKDSFDSYNGNGNIIIEGGAFNFNGFKHKAEGTALVIGHSNGITIRNVTFEDVSGGHGIELNSTKNAKIEGCSFLGYYDPGGRDFS